MSSSGAASEHAQSPQKQIRIVLADDHRVLRRGLQLLLESEPGLSVVAQAGEIAAARRQVLEHRPDVLVLDLNMPGAPVLEEIPRLRRDAPDTQIVVLTMEDEAAVATAVLGAGALAYVLKESAETDLVQAIRRAASGESYLKRDLAGRLAAQRIANSGWD